MPLGGARERFVLAMLLLNVGRRTTADALIDALWDEPPRSAKAQLHNLVSNVRRRLRDGDEGLGLIVSHRGGYELRLEPHELDLLEFRRLAVQGRQAAADGDHVRALSAFASALSLWRGPALADLADELVVGVRPPLHEEHFAAADAKLAAALAVGRYDEVLRELPALIAEHPYRECLHEKHMRALVGAGRSADALAGYRRVHRKFVDELGVEPGTSLRELERRILRGEVDPVPRPAAPIVTLRQLPPPIATLTGRDDLLAEITRVLGDEDNGPSQGGHQPAHGAEGGHQHVLAAEGHHQPLLGLLVGPGGVGKTALALAVAHGVTDAFPDGHLYADMRGNQECPADPHAVAGRFLRALGVDGSQVPDDPDERVSLYRSQLAGKRVLVVLDDVATEEQVRRLVPGTASCRVLVTSRRQLGALVGAARWTIPVLDTASAVRLLTRIVGPERVAAEPSAATEIVGLCARLPLAVGIASARLAVHTHWTLAEFRQRLAEERGRLDELSVGDLDVRASIALSYQGLDPLSRKLFRLLGLVEIADWPAWVAGALLGEPDERGARVLDHLVDAHLAQPVGRDAVGQGRFRLHDLVGDFAKERSLAEDTPTDRAAALSRVLSGWLALATECDERIPLRNVGLNVNFVGSCPRPTWDQWKCNGEGTMGDNNHEGHSGYRIDQLSAHVTSWVQTYQPSAVLLLVGTNDIAQNYDLPNAPARLSQLIDKILAARPNAVRVFVGSIIQFGSSVHDAKVKAYNDAVYRITQNKGAHVHFVPNHIIGKERGDLADGVHPTDCGYAKLSYLWYTYMEPELSSGWWPTGYWPWSYTGVCAR